MRNGKKWYWKKSKCTQNVPSNWQLFFDIKKWSELKLFHNFCGMTWLQCGNNLFPFSDTVTDCDSNFRCQAMKVSCVDSRLQIASHELFYLMERLKIRLKNKLGNQHCSTNLCLGSRCTLHWELLSTCGESFVNYNVCTAINLIILISKQLFLDWFDLYELILKIIEGKHHFYTHIWSYSNKNLRVFHQRDLRPF